MKVLLHDQLIAINRGIEFGEFFKGGHTCLDQKREHRDLDTGLFVFFVECDAQGFEFSDVGFVVVRDVRNHDPIAMQIRARNFLDARKWLGCDFAKFGEVDLGPGQ